MAIFLFLPIDKLCKIWYYISIKHKGRDLMVRVKDITKLFKISRPTLYEWIKNGCPVYRKGRLIFFDLSEVEQWVKNGVNNE